MPTLLSPLHQLFQDQWDAWLRFDPFFATYVGITGLTTACQFVRMMLTNLGASSLSGFVLAKCNINHGTISSGPT